MDFAYAKAIVEVTRVARGRGGHLSREKLDSGCHWQDYNFFWERKLRRKLHKKKYVIVI